MIKLVVWTRVRAESSTVWQRVSSPTVLSAALPWPLRWEVADPEGMREALDAGRTGRFPSRVVLGGPAVDWTADVLDVTPGLRFTTETRNAWFGRFLHRRRVERAVGGRVRLADEVILEPAHVGARVVAATVVRVLTRTHRRLLADLHPEPTGKIVHHLGLADLGHAEAMLGGIDLETR